MKRSDINRALRQATDCFARNGWVLPPAPKWDITDFGLGDFERAGLTLVNLADEPEYCEKLMYARKGQRTPCHTHAKKKEDIICRAGSLTLWLWPDRPATEEARGDGEFSVRIDGEPTRAKPGQPLELPAGRRVTLEPGTWHAFAPSSDECVIGEVSTANDDANDNFFVDPNIGRFPSIDEDETPLARLLSE